MFYIIMIRLLLERLISSLITLLGIFKANKKAICQTKTINQWEKVEKQRKNTVKFASFHVRV